MLASARLRWTRLAVAYFVLATAALVWPLYPALGNHIEPRLAGLPWSMVSILAVVIANTAVLVALYLAGVVDTAEAAEPRTTHPARARETGDG